MNFSVLISSGGGGDAAEDSPRENPSLWTSQTFSDSYQARSAAICSSVFTCGTGRRFTSAQEEAWNQGGVHA